MYDVILGAQAIVIVAICDGVAICDWKCHNLWRVSRFVTESVAICDNVKICNWMAYIQSRPLSRH